MSAPHDLQMNVAFKDPSRRFDHPNQVIDHPGLSYQEKRKILKQWEVDAKLLSVAEGEGMAGGEENQLGRVKAALKRLGRAPVAPKPARKTA